VTDDRVLISTHDLSRAGALREGFKDAGYGTELVTPAESVGDLDGAVLLVLTGGMEGGGGPLAEQARTELHIPVFAIAGGDTLAPALRPGFDEVFARSASVDEVVLLGSRVIERRRLQWMTGIVGETEPMREALERVVQIAPVASTVLVTGESGTGKELVARGIHLLSPRRHKPFIAVNVAALPETLLESELFGHEKGAFTGAIDARKGMFELAHGGTIFLDEMGEMPLTTQTKLLRVLEQREFHRVGGEKPIKVDVRIIAATNQDLRQLLAIGEFRRDLYYRLNVLHIELPSLRERRADIPLLVKSFVDEVSRTHDRAFPGISAEAMRILTEYAWPGNVRELRNLVESMVVLAPGGVIEPDDIPESVRAGRGGSLLPVPVSPPPATFGEGGGGGLRPELEFVFRTLVDLRVDVDELRSQFAAYRREQGVAPAGMFGVSGAAPGEIAVDAVGPTPVPAPEEAEIPLAREVEREVEAEAAPPEGVVVFRAGMTMDEMERQAIRAALDEVAGNRRKAAELLGIGERTLYRKISRYGLDA
jgi:DNA-binding NtrC family response regulator